MLTVNLETARHIIKSAEAKAESLGCAMNTAVVDAGGNLVAHVRCAPGPSRTSWPDARWLARALRSAVPSILAMSEALAQHAAYFDSGAAR
jgi:uncharacterized protein GlcG (DUF336 family)